MGEKLRALDLFCCAGGAGMGLHQAGFEVVGVDIGPQPRYPFEFHQTDALTFPLDGFDFIWASPPCQFTTALRHAPNAKRTHLNLIPAMRERLIASGLPWVIENVEQAKPHLRRPFTLCGTMFDLGTPAAGREFELQRHRLFETSFSVTPPPCRHRRPVIGVYGGHVRARAASVGGRRTRDFDDDHKPTLAARAMGIGWMTMNEMSQAIPPAYSEFIGRAAIAYIEQQRLAA